MRDARDFASREARQDFLDHDAHLHEPAHTCTRSTSAMIRPSEPAANTNGFWTR
ncbi:hypothetical protein ABIA32_006585 [Streptacidiphilus sp. MAP12-20]